MVQNCCEEKIGIEDRTEEEKGEGERKAYIITVTASRLFTMLSDRGIFYQLTALQFTFREQTHRRSLMQDGDGVLVAWITATRQACRGIRL